MGGEDVIKQYEKTDPAVVPNPLGEGNFIKYVLCARKECIEDEG
jgi:hypothetical protein